MENNKSCNWPVLALFLVGFVMVAINLYELYVGHKSTSVVATTDSTPTVVVLLDKASPTHVLGVITGHVAPGADTKTYCSTFAHALQRAGINVAEVGRLRTQCSANELQGAMSTALRKLMVPDTYIPMTPPQ